MRENYLTHFLGLLSGISLAFVIAGCVPPGPVLSSNGCHVLEPLATPLTPHATIRVRVVEPTPSLSLSPADTVTTLNPAQKLQSNQLRNALIEALAQREDLLLKVLGWRELQAYRGHAENQKRTDQSGDWEFGESGFDGREKFNISSLIDPEEWEAAPYEVIGMLGDSRYAAQDMTNPITGSATSSYVHSATVRVRLFERATGQRLMDVAIPVTGDDLMAEAARRFAGELASQIWGSREGDDTTESGL